ncbi:hypothetical protein C8R43DRAFT_952745 [Mycena crocata]|nr:hypothetical protein C8R43DRAFT_952745 [Mycena crocata]
MYPRLADLRYPTTLIEVVFSPPHRQSVVQYASLHPSASVVIEGVVKGFQTRPVSSKGTPMHTIFLGADDPPEERAQFTLCTTILRDIVISDQISANIQRLCFTVADQWLPSTMRSPAPMENTDLLLVTPFIALEHTDVCETPIANIKLGSRVSAICKMHRVESVFLGLLRRRVYLLLPIQMRWARMSKVVSDLPFDGRSIPGDLASHVNLLSNHTVMADVSTPRFPSLGFFSSESKNVAGPWLSDLSTDHLKPIYRPVGTASGSFTYKTAPTLQTVARAFIYGEITAIEERQSNSDEGSHFSAANGGTFLIGTQRVSIGVPTLSTPTARDLFARNVVSLSNIVASERKKSQGGTTTEHWVSIKDRDHPENGAIFVDYGDATEIKAGPIHVGACVLFDVTLHRHDSYPERTWGIEHAYSLVAHSGERVDRKFLQATGWIGPQICALPLGNTIALVQDDMRRMQMDEGKQDEATANGDSTAGDSHSESARKERCVTMLPFRLFPSSKLCCPKRKPTWSSRFVLSLPLLSGDPISLKVNATTARNNWFAHLWPPTVCRALGLIRYCTAPTAPPNFARSRLVPVTLRDLGSIWDVYRSSPLWVQTPETRQLDSSAKVDYIPWLECQPNVFGLDYEEVTMTLSNAAGTEPALIILQIFSFNQYSCSSQTPNAAVRMLMSERREDWFGNILVVACDAHGSFRDMTAGDMAAATVAVTRIELQPIHLRRNCFILLNDAAEGLDLFMIKSDDLARGVDRRLEAHVKCIGLRRLTKAHSFENLVDFPKQMPSIVAQSFLYIVSDNSLLFWLQSRARILRWLMHGGRASEYERASEKKGETGLDAEDNAKNFLANARHETDFVATRDQSIAVGSVSTFKRVNGECSPTRLHRGALRPYYCNVFGRVDSLEQTPQGLLIRVACPVGVSCLVRDCYDRQMKALQEALREDWREPVRSYSLVQPTPLTMSKDGVVVGSWFSTNWRPDEYGFVENMFYAYVPPRIREKSYAKHLGIGEDVEMMVCLKNIQGHDEARGGLIYQYKMKVQEMWPLRDNFDMPEAGPEYVCDLSLHGTCHWCEGRVHHVRSPV